jgi:DNA-binding MarR family transcriptional regulator
MHLFEVPQNENVDFTGIESPYFLLGLLSAFDNRFQATADRLIGEVSWKQFFTIICINLCKEAPTLRQLAEVMGTSHQNCKQLLIKLEKKGFVALTPDPTD